MNGKFALFNLHQNKFYSISLCTLYASVLHIAAFLFLLNHKVEKIRQKENISSVSITLKKVQSAPASKNVLNKIEEKPEKIKHLSKKSIAHAKTKNLIVETPQNKFSENNLKNFFPTNREINKWREEGARLNKNQNAFLENDFTPDKNYSKILEVSSSLQAKLQIPFVLRRVFEATDIRIKILKKQNGIWKISSIYGKNPYFRAFFYDLIKEDLADKFFTKTLNDADANEFEITLNYLKLKSIDDPGLDEKSQISHNVISFSFTEKVKPDEYAMIAGGINILGIAGYAYEKAFPDEYKNNPEVIEMRKSYAFSHEGIVNLD